MKKLTMNQIIDLFNLGRTIILFGASGTISCHKHNITESQLIEYINKNDKHGRILQRLFYLSIDSNDSHYDYHLQSLY